MKKHKQNWRGSPLLTRIKNAQNVIANGSYFEKKDAKKVILPHIGRTFYRMCTQFGLGQVLKS